jgi:hypothetical protein
MTIIEVGSTSGLISALVRVGLHLLEEAVFAGRRIVGRARRRVGLDRRRCGLAGR